MTSTSHYRSALPPKLDAVGTGAAATETGAAGAATAVAGADLGSETGAAAAPAASSNTTTVPCLTLSPSLTLSSVTTPPSLAGISMEALSDSTVIRLCSGLMVSPTLTSSSMTATSSRSPISGTLISTIAIYQFLRAARGGSHPGSGPGTR